MAFLCPARRKRSKIKIKGSRPLDAPLPGRITGSASIDTLVRVGLEKQHGTRTPMVVLHDFFPCVDDELDVKRNQLVHLLYQENDWMYVIAEDGREGFIPYTYCLPVQRSVDDFVVHKSKKKREDDRERLIAPPPYKNSQNNTGAKPLVRSASKSMPDISDIGTNSSDSTGFVSKHSRHAYSQQNGHLNYSLGYANKAFMKSNSGTDKSYGSSNGLFSNADEPLLDTSIADIRNASAAIREKQKQVIQSRKISKSKGYATQALPRSAPSSPRSQQSNHSNASRVAHSSHSNQGSAGNSDKPYKSNEISHRPHTQHNYRYMNHTSGSSVHSNNQATANRNRSGSVGALEDTLSKSWGPSSGQAQVRTGRTLSNNTSSYHGMYSSSRSYVNHPYGISSVHNNRHSNRHSYHSNYDPKSNLQPAKTHSRKFHKTAQGQYIALFQFTAQQENDISVERGEFVTVLNKEDMDWYWIKRSNNQEGFVPSNYVRQADAIPVHRESSEIQTSPSSSGQASSTWVTNSGTGSHAKESFSSQVQQSSPLSQSQQRSNQNTPRGSTRLVCLYDYRAQAPDDLTVTRGEWLYADLNNQSDPDWLWVFSPSQSIAGYIPRTYAKPPNFAFMQNNRDYGC